MSLERLLKIPVLCLAATFSSSIPAGLFSEENIKDVQTSIVDYFDKKEVTYRIEFVFIGKHSIDANVKIEKTAAHRYKLSVKAKKPLLSYAFETEGFECGDRLCPTYAQESSRVILESNKEITSFYYDGSVVNRIECEFYSVDGSSKKVFEGKSIIHNPETTDLYSGILNEIYSIKEGKGVNIMNVVDNGSIERFKFEQEGDKLKLLLTKEQEEEMQMKGLEARLKDGWPELITIDKIWLIKNMKITMVKKNF